MGGPGAGSKAPEGHDTDAPYGDIAGRWDNPPATISGPAVEAGFIDGLPHDAWAETIYVGPFEGTPTIASAENEAGVFTVAVAQKVREGGGTGEEAQEARSGILEVKLAPASSNGYEKLGADWRVKLTATSRTGSAIRNGLTESNGGALLSEGFPVSGACEPTTGDDLVAFTQEGLSENEVVLTFPKGAGEAVLCLSYDLGSETGSGPGGSDGGPTRFEIALEYGVKADNTAPGASEYSNLSIINAQVENPGPSIRAAVEDADAYAPEISAITATGSATLAERSSPAKERHLAADRTFTATISLESDLEISGLGDGESAVFDLSVEEILNLGEDSETTTQAAFQASSGTTLPALSSGGTGITSYTISAADDGDGGLDLAHHVGSTSPATADITLTITMPDAVDNTATDSGAPAARNETDFWGPNNLIQPNRTFRLTATPDSDTLNTRGVKVAAISVDFTIEDDDGNLTLVVADDDSLKAREGVARKLIARIVNPEVGTSFEGIGEPVNFTLTLEDPTSGVNVENYADGVVGGTDYIVRGTIPNPAPKDADSATQTTFTYTLPYDNSLSHRRSINLNLAEAATAAGANPYTRKDGLVGKTASLTVNSTEATNKEFAVIQLWEDASPAGDQSSATLIGPATVADLAEGGDWGTILASEGQAGKRYFFRLAMLDPAQGHTKFLKVGEDGDEYVIAKSQTTGLVSVDLKAPTATTAAVPDHTKLTLDGAAFTADKKLNFTHDGETPNFQLSYNDTLIGGSGVGSKGPEDANVPSRDIPGRWDEPILTLRAVDTTLLSRFSYLDINDILEPNFVFLPGGEGKPGSTGGAGVAQPGHWAETFYLQNDDDLAALAGSTPQMLKEAGGKSNERGQNGIYQLTFTPTSPATALGAQWAAKLVFAAETDGVARSGLTVNRLTAAKGGCTPAVAGAAAPSWSGAAGATEGAIIFAEGTESATLCFELTLADDTGGTSGAARGENGSDGGATAVSATISYDLKADGTPASGNAETSFIDALVAPPASTSVDVKDADAYTPAITLSTGSGAKQVTSTAGETPASISEQDVTVSGSFPRYTLTFPAIPQGQEIGGLGAGATARWDISMVEVAADGTESDAGWGIYAAGGQITTPKYIIADRSGTINHYVQSSNLVALSGTAAASPHSVTISMAQNNAYSGHDDGIEGPVTLRVKLTPQAASLANVDIAASSVDIILADHDDGAFADLRIFTGGSDGKIFGPHSGQLAQTATLADRTISTTDSAKGFNAALYLCGRTTDDDTSALTDGDTPPTSCDTKYADDAITFTATALAGDERLTTANGGFKAGKTLGDVLWERGNTAWNNGDGNGKLVISAGANNSAIQIGTTLGRATTPTIGFEETGPSNADPDITVLKTGTLALSVESDYSRGNFLDGTDEEDQTNDINHRNFRFTGQYLFPDTTLSVAEGANVAVKFGVDKPSVVDTIFKTLSDFSLRIGGGSTGDSDDFNRPTYNDPVTIDAGETEADLVTLTALADNKVEGNETYIYTMNSRSAPKYYPTAKSGEDEVTITITDGDDDKAKIRIFLVDAGDEDSTVAAGSETDLTSLVSTQGRPKGTRVKLKAELYSTDAGNPLLTTSKPIAIVFPRDFLAGFARFVPGTVANAAELGISGSVPGIFGQGGTLTIPANASSGISTDSIVLKPPSTTAGKGVLLWGSVGSITFGTGSSAITLGTTDAPTFGLNRGTSSSGGDLIIGSLTRGGARARLPIVNNIIPGFAVADTDASTTAIAAAGATTASYSFPRATFPAGSPPTSAITITPQATIGLPASSTGVFTLKVLDGASGTDALAGATISPAGGKFTYTSDAGGAVTLSPASATVTLPAGYGQNDVVGEDDKVFRLLLEASKKDNERPTSGAPLGNSTTTITIQDNTDDVTKMRLFYVDATSEAAITSFVTENAKRAGTTIKLKAELYSSESGHRLLTTDKPIVITMPANFMTALAGAVVFVASKTELGIGSVSSGLFVSGGTLTIPANASSAVSTDSITIKPTAAAATAGKKVYLDLPTRSSTTFGGVGMTAADTPAFAFSFRDIVLNEQTRGSGTNHPPIVDALSAKFVVKSGTESTDPRIAGPDDDSADIADGFAVAQGSSTPTLRVEPGDFDGTLPAGETAVFTLKAYRGTSGTNAISGATINPSGGRITYTADSNGNVSVSPQSLIITLPADHAGNDMVGEAGKTVRLVMEPSTTAGEFPSGANVPPPADAVKTFTIADDDSATAKLVLTLVRENDAANTPLTGLATNLDHKLQLRAQVCANGAESSCANPLTLASGANIDITPALVTGSDYLVGLGDPSQFATGSALPAAFRVSAGTSEGKSAVFTLNPSMAAKKIALTGTFLPAAIGDFTSADVIGTADVTTAQLRMALSAKAGDAEVAATGAGENFAVDLPDGETLTVIVEINSPVQGTAKGFTLTLGDFTGSFLPATDIANSAITIGGTSATLSTANVLTGTIAVGQAAAEVVIPLVAKAQITPERGFTVTLAAADSTALDGDKDVLHVTVPRKTGTASLSVGDPAAQTAVISEGAVATPLTITLDPPTASGSNPRDRRFTIRLNDSASGVDNGDLSFSLTADGMNPETDGDIRVVVPQSTGTTTVYVSSVADNTLENEEVYPLTLTVGNNQDYTAATGGAAVVTLTQPSEAGQITFAAQPFADADTPGTPLAALGEGETARVTLGYAGVVATGGQAVAVTFNLGGTATAGDDYTLTSPTTVTFPAGTNPTTTFDIPIASDAANEGDETIVLSIASVSGGLAKIVGTPTATLTIEDATETLVQFDAAAYAGTEGGDDAVTLRITGAALASPAQVRFETAAMTPVSASTADFLTGGMILTIPAGPSPRTVSVPLAEAVTFGTPSNRPLIVDDSIAEPANEDFTLSLDAVDGSGLMLGAQTSATITIHDNDNFMRIVEGAASTPITAAKTIREGGDAPAAGVIENLDADGNPYNSLRFVLEMDVAPGVAPALSYVVTSGGEAPSTPLDYTFVREGSTGLPLQNLGASGTISTIASDRDLVFVFTANTDTDFEPSEEFTITFTLNTPGISFPTKSLVINIKDEDTLDLGHKSRLTVESVNEKFAPDNLVTGQREDGKVTLKLRRRDFTGPSDSYTVNYKVYRATSTRPATYASTDWVEVPNSAGSGTLSSNAENRKVVVKVPAVTFSEFRSLGLTGTEETFYHVHFEEVAGGTFNDNINLPNEGGVNTDDDGRVDVLARSQDAIFTPAFMDAAQPGDRTVQSGNGTAQDPFLIPEEILLPNAQLRVQSAPVASESGIPWDGSTRNDANLVYTVKLEIAGETTQPVQAGVVDDRDPGSPPVTGLGPTQYQVFNGNAININFMQTGNRATDNIDTNKNILISFGAIPALGWANDDQVTGDRNFTLRLEESSGFSAARANGYKITPEADLNVLHYRIVEDDRPSFAVQHILLGDYDAATPSNNDDNWVSGLPKTLEEGDAGFALRLVSGLSLAEDVIANVQVENVPVGGSAIAARGLQPSRSVTGTIVPVSSLRLEKPSKESDPIFFRLPAADTSVDLPSTNRITLAVQESPLGKVAAETVENGTEIRINEAATSAPAPMFTQQAMSTGPSPTLVAAPLHEEGDDGGLWVDLNVGAGATTGAPYRMELVLLADDAVLEDLEINTSGAQIADKGGAANADAGNTGPWTIEFASGTNASTDTLAIPIKFATDPDDNRDGTPSVTAELRGVSADGVLTTTTTIPLRLNVVDDDDPLTTFASADIFEPDIAALFPALSTGRVAPNASSDFKIDAEISPADSPLAAVFVTGGWTAGALTTNGQEYTKTFTIASGDTDGLSLSDLGLDGLTDDTEVTPGGRTTITLEIDTSLSGFTAENDGSGNFAYNGLTVSGDPATITIFDDDRAYTLNKAENNHYASSKPGLHEIADSGNLDNDEHTEKLLGLVEGMSHNATLSLGEGNGMPSGAQFDRLSTFPTSVYAVSPTGDTSTRFGSAAGSCVWNTTASENLHDSVSLGSVRVRNNNRAEAHAPFNFGGADGLIVVSCGTRDFNLRPAEGQPSGLWIFNDDIPSRTAEAYLSQGGTQELARSVSGVYEVVSGSNAPRYNIGLRLPQSVGYDVSLSGDDRGARAVLIYEEALTGGTFAQRTLLSVPAIVSIPAGETEAVGDITIQARTSLAARTSAIATPKLNSGGNELPNNVAGRFPSVLRFDGLYVRPALASREWAINWLDPAALPASLPSGSRVGGLATATIINTATGYLVEDHAPTTSVNQSFVLHVVRENKTSLEDVCFIPTLSGVGFSDDDYKAEVVHHIGGAGTTADAAAPLGATTNAACTDNRIGAVWWPALTSGSDKHQQVFIRFQPVADTTPEDSAAFPDDATTPWNVGDVDGSQEYIPAGFDDDNKPTPASGFIRYGYAGFRGEEASLSVTLLNAELEDTDTALSIPSDTLRFIDDDVELAFDLPTNIVGKPFVEEDKVTRFFIRLSKWVPNTRANATDKGTPTTFIATNWVSVESNITGFDPARADLTSPSGTWMIEGTEFAAGTGGTHAEGISFSPPGAERQFVNLSLLPVGTGSGERPGWINAPAEPYKLLVEDLNGPEVYIYPVYNAGRRADGNHAPPATRLQGFASDKPLGNTLAVPQGYYDTANPPGFSVPSGLVLPAFFASNSAGVNTVQRGLVTGSVYEPKIALEAQPNPRTRPDSIETPSAQVEGTARWARFVLYVEIRGGDGANRPSSADIAANAPFSGLPSRKVPYIPFNYHLPITVASGGVDFATRGKDFQFFYPERSSSGVLLRTDRFFNNDDGNAGAFTLRRSGHTNNDFANAPVIDVYGDTEPESEEIIRPMVDFSHPLARGLKRYKGAYQPQDLVIHNDPDDALTVTITAGDAEGSGAVTSATDDRVQTLLEGGPDTGAVGTTGLAFMQFRFSQDVSAGTQVRFGLRPAPLTTGAITADGTLETGKLSQFDIFGGLRGSDGSVTRRDNTLTSEGTLALPALAANATYTVFVRNREDSIVSEVVDYGSGNVGTFLQLEFLPLNGVKIDETASTVRPTLSVLATDNEPVAELAVLALHEYSAGGRLLKSNSSPSSLSGERSGAARIANSGDAGVYERNDGSRFRITEGSYIGASVGLKESKVFERPFSVSAFALPYSFRLAPSIAAFFNAEFFFNELYYASGNDGDGGLNQARDILNRDGETSTVIVESLISHADKDDDYDVANILALQTAIAAGTHIFPPTGTKESPANARVPTGANRLLIGTAGGVKTLNNRMIDERQCRVGFYGSAALNADPFSNLFDGGSYDSNLQLGDIFNTNKISRGSARIGNASTDETIIPFAICDDDTGVIAPSDGSGTAAQATKEGQAYKVRIDFTDADAHASEDIPLRILIGGRNGEVNALDFGTTETQIASAFSATYTNYTDLGTPGGRYTRVLYHAPEDETPFSGTYTTTRGDTAVDNDVVKSEVEGVADTVGDGSGVVTPTLTVKRANLDGSLNPNGNAVLVTAVLRGTDYVADHDVGVFTDHAQLYRFKNDDFILSATPIADADLSEGVELFTARVLAPTDNVPERVKDGSIRFSGQAYTANVSEGGDPVSLQVSSASTYGEAGARRKLNGLTFTLRRNNADFSAGLGGALHVFFAVGPTDSEQSANAEDFTSGVFSPVFNGTKYSVTIGANAASATYSRGPNIISDDNVLEGNETFAVRVLCVLRGGSATYSRCTGTNNENQFGRLVARDTRTSGAGAPPLHPRQPRHLRLHPRRQRHQVRPRPPGDQPRHDLPLRLPRGQQRRHG